MQRYPSIRRAGTRIAQRKQEARLVVRVFSDELESLRNSAKNANKDVSSFVRDKLFSPNGDQSPANRSEDCDPVESLAEQTEQKSERKLSPRHLGQNSRAIGAQSAPKDEVSGRTGHRPGCSCFACGRLRALLSQVNRADNDEK